MWTASYKSFNGLRFWWVLLFCIYACIHICFAQEQVKEKKNSIYIEGFGAGAYYSLNYGRLIYKQSQYVVSARIGLSSYHFKDFTDEVNPDIIVPLGFQFAYGKQHQIVTGFGNTFTSLVQSSDLNFEPKRTLNSSAYLAIGYRFRKIGSPYFFECAYNPLFERYEHFRHWGALVVGRFF